MTIRTLAASALVVTAFASGLLVGGVLASRPHLPDAHRIRVVVTNPYNAADPRPLLPAAWTRATGGLGSLEVVTDPERADAFLLVLPGDVPASSWAVTGGRRAIVIGVASAAVQTYGPIVIVHEIAHIWCCDVAGVRDGHWTDDTESGLMNASLYGQEGGVFSTRELRALGLSR